MFRVDGPSDRGVLQASFHSASSRVSKVVFSCLAGMSLALSPVSLSAQTYTHKILHSLTCEDGAGPQARLANSGSYLYGTAYSGGKNNGGTVFKVGVNATDSSTESKTADLIYSFGPNGDFPIGDLVAQSGLLYGTATVGGVGAGAVFQINPGSKTETERVSFVGGDGGYPYGGLVASKVKANTFYGATANGGNSGTTGGQGGVVYSVTSTDLEPSVIYFFCSKLQDGQCLDGTAPHGDLVEDSAGNLYGTTYAGGKYAEGTVFKINPNAAEGKRLVWSYSFGAPLSNGDVDGATPQAGLAISPSGFLYGTTLYGGPQGKGTVFAVNASTGKEIPIWYFLGSPTDGQGPMSQLIAASVPGASGVYMLYGTTTSGGTSLLGGGTVFELIVKGMARYGGQNTRDGLLWSSSGLPADGTNLQAGVIMVDGALYGTTVNGGIYGCGTVYKLTPSN